MLIALAFPTRPGLSNKMVELSKYELWIPCSLLNDLLSPTQVNEADESIRDEIIAWGHIFNAETVGRNVMQAEM